MCVKQKVKVVIQKRKALLPFLEAPPLLFAMAVRTYEIFSSPLDICR